MAGLVNENLKHSTYGIQLSGLSPKDAEKLRQLQEIMARKKAEEAQERIREGTLRRAMGPIFQPIYAIPGAGGATEGVIQTNTNRYHVYDTGYGIWATDVYTEGLTKGLVVFPSVVWNDLTSVGIDLRMYVGVEHPWVGRVNVEVDPNLARGEFYITFKPHIPVDPLVDPVYGPEWAVRRDGVKLTNIKYPADNTFRSEK